MRYSAKWTWVAGYEPVTVQHLADPSGLTVKQERYSAQERAGNAIVLQHVIRITVAVTASTDRYTPLQVDVVVESSPWSWQTRSTKSTSTLRTRCIPSGDNVLAAMQHTCSTTAPRYLAIPQSPFKTQSSVQRRIRTPCRLPTLVCSHQ